MRYFRASGFAIAVFASAAVAAQSADFIVVDAPILQIDFQRVFQQGGGRIFVIGNFTDLIASVGLPVLVTAPDMKFDSELLYLDQELMAIEGDGLLLPAERFETK